MKEITNYDYKFWADAADNLIKGLPKLLSAIKTLESKGYTYQGGELWKPPLGKKPDFNLIDSLNEKIKELESEEYINEIKAQRIADYLENDSLQYVNSYDANYGVSVDHIESEIKKLRNNNE